MSHSIMVLKREDICAFVANWGDKAAAICRIRDELNIGLDSMVFLDDNAKPPVYWCAEWCSS